MDCNAFAAHIEELLNNKPLAQRLGEAGLKLVTERFDFDSYIKDLESMFERVIQEKRV
jgi:glycosyltransferase involved in cell wall biosynthesis